MCYNTLWKQTISVKIRYTDSHVLVPLTAAEWMVAMKKIVLGKTGIEVTELCFGALPIGPLQKNVDVDKAAGIIAKALRMGVNFVDTAQGYRTYPHVRKAMEMTGITPVISTKSPAAAYEDMDRAVQEALNGLGVSMLDIFFIHAARADAGVFEQRAGAIRCLQDYKEKGIIRAVGISTHSAPVASLAAEKPELDVVFPILNRKGLGILDGTREEMEAATEKCFSAGKGVFLMKVLAGGNLCGDYVRAVEYARDFVRGRAALAIGMIAEEEVEMNVRYFNGEDITGIREQVAVPRKEFFVFTANCISCGKCVEACHSGAVTVDQGKSAVIDKEKCLTCGYCVESCPRFAIRML